ncbi:MAG: hypothetical protein KIT39_11705 [Nitrospirales bacterium]|nr:hypothetical protein [Nitrospirales bacterium]
MPWIILEEHIEISERQVQRFVRTFTPNAPPNPEEMFIKIASPCIERFTLLQRM